MSWHRGDGTRALSYTSLDVGSSSEGALEAVKAVQMDSTHSTQQVDWSLDPRSCSKPSLDIQLLNDDQEKAILSDLCKAGGPESTPLTTFSYISEYICSNNIDIWPGEIASSTDTSAKLESENGEQRLPRASCMHQQVYLKCKRVLESIIARNEQILALLNQKRYTNKSLKRLR